MFLGVGPRRATPSEGTPPDVPRPHPTTSRSSPNAFASAFRCAASTAGTIPLRTCDGQDLGATEAAHALLLSGASLLPTDYADAFVFQALARAGEVEAAACLAGEAASVITAKVTAVLVSAAVRASILARGPNVSPTEINRATLSWYEMSHLRRRELLGSGWIAQDQRQTA